MAESNNRTPLIVFAALADIQYGDFEDGYNFSKTQKRYYRNALVCQQNAIKQWSGRSPEVEFIIQLGDIIDGINKQHGISEQSLQTVLEAFGNFKVYHIIGNHELYNFNRAELINKPLYSAGLTECQGYSTSLDQFYYTLLPHPALRIVVLDSYDLAAIGWPEDTENHLHGLKYLENNINEEKNSPSNMVGVQKRFLKLNGGVGDTQLQWLDKVLSDCNQNKENAIVIAHQPICLQATEPTCLLWNYEEVLSIIHKHPSVISYISGHDHSGGSAVDEQGLQHITFPAVLETSPDDETPVATISLYNDMLQIEGHGSINNFDIKLKFPYKMPQIS